MPSKAPTTDSPSRTVARTICHFCSSPNASSFVVGCAGAVTVEAFRALVTVAEALDEAVAAPADLGIGIGSTRLCVPPDGVALGSDAVEAVGGAVAGTVEPALPGITGGSDAGVDVVATLSF